MAIKKKTAPEVLAAEQFDTLSARAKAGGDYGKMEY